MGKSVFSLMFTFRVIHPPRDMYNDYTKELIKTPQKPLQMKESRPPEGAP